MENFKQKTGKVLKKVGHGFVAIANMPRKAYQKVKDYIKNKRKLDELEERLYLNNYKNQLQDLSKKYGENFLKNEDYKKESKDIIEKVQNIQEELNTKLNENAEVIKIFNKKIEDKANEAAALAEINKIYGEEQKEKEETDTIITEEQKRITDLLNTLAADNVKYEEQIQEINEILSAYQPALKLVDLRQELESIKEKIETESLSEEEKKELESQKALYEKEIENIIKEKRGIVEEPVQHNIEDDFMVKSLEEPEDEILVEEKAHHNLKNDFILNDNEDEAQPKEEVIETETKEQKKKREQIKEIDKELAKLTTKKTKEGALSKEEEAHYQDLLNKKEQILKGKNITNNSSTTSVQVVPSEESKQDLKGKQVVFTDQDKQQDATPGNSVMEDETIEKEEKEERKIIDVKKLVPCFIASKIEWGKIKKRARKVVLSQNNKDINEDKVLKDFVMLDTFVSANAINEAMDLNAGIFKAENIKGEKVLTDLAGKSIYGIKKNGFRKKEQVANNINLEGKNSRQTRGMLHDIQSSFKEKYSGFKFYIGDSDEPVSIGEAIQEVYRILKEKGKEQIKPEDICDYLQIDDKNYINPAVGEMKKLVAYEFTLRILAKEKANCEEANNTMAIRITGNDKKQTVVKPANLAIDTSDNKNNREVDTPVDSEKTKKTETKQKENKQNKTAGKFAQQVKKQQVPTNQGNLLNL